MDISFPGGDNLTSAVPKRPTVIAPKFGEWLEMRRGDRSLEQIAQKVRPLVREAGLKVDQSLIYKLEHGRVPSWPMLMALARVYETPLDEVMRYLGIAITFPGREPVMSSSTKDRDDSAHPRDESAHGEKISKKRARVTQSDRPPTEKWRLSSTPLVGGADAAAEGTAARRRQSESSLDAEVRAGILADRQALIEEFVERLYANADDARAIADALQAAAVPPSPGTAGSVHAGGRAPVRRATGRRSRP